MDRNIVLKGILWKLGERGGVQIIQFVVQLVLARLLTPNDYGVLAIVLVFISLSNIFIQSGLPTALIQKKNTDIIDESSVFYTSMLISLSCIIIIWFTSPYIAIFYNDQELSFYLRCISFILIIGSFNSVQIALISKKLAFNINFYSSIISVVISAGIGIWMALSGWGVWSLIVQYASNIIISTIVIYILFPWKPSLKFSYTRTKNLFSFGSGIFTANLLSNLFTDIYSLIIGKIYSKGWLGFYDTGNRIPATVANSLTTSVQSVLLPAFSLIQEDKDRIKVMMRRSVQVSAFFIFPVMFLLAAAAKPLILILLTEKWAFAIPFLQLACILYAFYPIHSTNLQAINAIGRSDIFMKCEVQKKIVELIILCMTIWFSIYIMAVGRVISSLIALYINMSPNRKFIHYGFKEQIMDLSKAFLISLFVSIIVFAISFLPISLWIMLIFQILIGLSLYIYLSDKYNNESFNYIIATIKNFNQK